MGDKKHNRGQMNFLYCCKIRNRLLPRSNQYSEKTAQMVISANSSQSAMRWGDALTNCYCSRNPQMEKMNSMTSDVLSDVPARIISLNYGEYATDGQVGW